MTVIALFLLLPIYAQDNDVYFTYILPSLSSMDKLTIVDSLRNPDVAFLVVLLAILFSLLAYYFIYQFGMQMSNFEFQPTQQYLDTFVSSHSIMIRGIN
mmetsp:Transcript_44378/g.32432  ORF Transcript_44378/g.32432 Transcript_44378/m.32432 type:complete len:99 (+) Transcript_44378:611-907(+)